ncbi:MAG: malto-oligosyltrehalose trehalohydrolase [Verrucomicrobia bacterium]|nr:MAG: malto-oligosyltrehalose trehalohydrolase [Verrucomicrobiota bacterium]
MLTGGGERLSTFPLGATVHPHGVAYRVWAPAVQSVQVEIQPVNCKPIKILSLERQAHGYYMGVDEEGQAGYAYLYHLEGKGRFADPVSRGQQAGVEGRSLVVNWRGYRWRDRSWRRPRFRDLVIYELHIGTFTSEGTFRSAIERLDHLKRLGITAIEIMPIGDFPGGRNWGYDGVLPYAPARCYGSPDELRDLVDSAHSNGLAVILDVIYNHFGPRGNYLSCFTSHYFNPEHLTPWGDSLNFDSTQCGPVREYFVNNPLYWMEEFHIDGFRFDATHEIRDNSHPHILAEMTTAVHQQGGYAIAEDERNVSFLLESVETGGMGFDAVWADDFHHTLRVGQTHEKSGYFSDYKGSLSEAISTLDCGWLYQGQISQRQGLSRGTPCKHLLPERFIHCISNHDQTGNHAFGTRLSQLISAPAYRTLSALLCLSPYTPLIFMGQEWAASTPFLYFTDHDAEFGAEVTKGRQQEFSEFAEFTKQIIPDPQADTSFLQSKLQWAESEQGEHAQVCALYSECLHLRKKIGALRPVGREGWSVKSLPWGAGTIHYLSQKTEYLTVFDLLGNHAGPLETPGGEWAILLSTEEKRFGGDQKIDFDPLGKTIRFSRPGLLFLSRQHGEGK